MSEPMTVRVEVWPVAADDVGIWLISGMDAWRAALPVPADSEPHAEVELLLSTNGIDGSDVPLLHSTSWRVDGATVVLTYVAVIRRPGLVRESWPQALPVSLDLAAEVGRPPTHGAAEVPVPRYVDVLLHALRHVAFLRDSDGTARAALDVHWLAHLARLRPALAGMYEAEHTPVVLPQTA
jgi:hypothetical protein